jgi:hypothetical protein
MFRWTIDPKKGDSSALHVFAVNRLNRFAPGGRPFNIFDYIWNELRRVMDDSRKHLPYAPYIMYMIERVTKTTFPKDAKHEPLHLRSRGEDAPPPPNHGGPSSSAPSFMWSTLDIMLHHMFLALRANMVTAPWSRECFTLSFACARPWSVKSMRIAVILLR